jgi:hypothetical protein
MLKRAALSILLVLQAPAHGQPQSEPTTQPDIKGQIDTVLKDAAIAIEHGQIELANKMLDAVIQVDPDNIEANFLKGTIAEQEERWDDAIVIFRAILDQHPELDRVRLEYARSLFETKQDEEADYNFRLALPRVPGPVTGNIYAFLNQIATRERITSSLSVGGGPDTNINAASSANQLTLFGLPFNVTPGSQAKFGFGVVVNGNAEYRLPLSGSLEDVRLRGGGVFYRAEYFGGHGKFDDMIGRIYAGPQYLFNRGDASLLAVANERWYGNDPYSWGYGPRAEFNYSVTDRILLQTGLEYTPDWYHTQTFQNGHLLTWLATTNFVVSPSSYIALITGVSKEHDASPEFSNLSYRIGLGYQSELPLGVTAYIQPDLVLGDYVAASPSFGTTRRDRLVRVQLAVTKRDIRLYGFSPSLTYNFADNISNQPLFAFTRHQILIGFSRAF